MPRNKFTRAEIAELIQKRRKEALAAIGALQGKEVWSEQEWINFNVATAMVKFTSELLEKIGPSTTADNGD